MVSKTKQLIYRPNYRRGRQKTLRVRRRNRFEMKIPPASSHRSRDICTVCAAECLAACIMCYVRTLGTTVSKRVRMPVEPLPICAATKQTHNDVLDDTCARTPGAYIQGDFSFYFYRDVVKPRPGFLLFLITFLSMFLS